MRLLLDESLPRRLRDHVPDHKVSTVIDMGWGGTKNGGLLGRAATEFDAFIAADLNHALGSLRSRTLVEVDL